MPERQAPWRRVPVGRVPIQRVVLSQRDLAVEPARRLRGALKGRQFQPVAIPRKKVFQLVCRFRQRTRLCDQVIKARNTLFAVPDITPGNFKLAFLPLLIHSEST